jgi:hypothetical protein
MESMDSTFDRRAQSYRPTMVQEFLHLSALNSFAVVQPILDSLVNNVAFLRYYDYSPAAVLLAVVLLTLGIPASFLSLRAVLHRLGYPKFADAIRTILMVVLMLLALLYAARWASATLWRALYSLSEDVFFLPAIFTAGWLARLYFRAEIFRQLLSTSAVGVLLFPAVFFLNPAVQEQVLMVPAREYFQPVIARSPASVIFVVFDGLSGMALLDENHEVDRTRYPSFARLSDRCNFYRNASTVHTRTDHALPAILSGSLPTGLQHPVESEYPLNLFRLLDNSRQFQQSIFEPYTQLAPEHLQRIDRQASIPRQTLDLLDTVLRVYQRMCLPQLMDSLALDVPREWFRLLPPAPADPKVLDGKIVYLWDADQDLQVDHFIKCMRPSDQPASRFLHISVPHDPWTRLDSGKQYRRMNIGPDAIPGEDSGSWSDDEWLVNQGWQRYLLQVRFADLCLGRILDRLEETGLFDESMIVVTADHGFAFRAGCSRRDPQGETLSDLIPVPLFIKYPQQTESMISDRNVETIDILPTIADVLGMPKDSNWDGESLMTEVPERPRKMVVASPAIILEAAFPGRFEYVDRLHKVFGKGVEGAFTDLQFLPELSGREASPLLSSAQSKLTLTLSEGCLPAEAGEQNLVPCYYHGQMSGATSADKPAILAVTVNGRIQATTRTSVAPTSYGEWSVMVPPHAFTDATDRVQFFEVEQKAGGIELHELLLE